jgi:hypothetical protein
MRSIPLTRGLTALVDDQDFLRLAAFTWHAHKARGRRTAARGQFYAARALDHRHRVFMHHDIMGERPGYQIDHRNGNGLDNRRSNLRWATGSQNQQNKAKVGGTSPFKGVYRLRSGPRPWRATITIQGRRLHLGVFKREEDAALAYDAAARQHFGEFAYLNFPARAA